MAKLILIAIFSFCVVGLYFYGMDYFLMSSQGLEVGWDLMPKSTP